LAKTGQAGEKEEKRFSKEEEMKMLSSMRRLL